MTKKNILTAAVSLSLVACLSIGATLAYFTDKSDVMTNTFVSGKVKITLTDKTNSPKGQEVKDVNGVQTGILYTDVVPGDSLNKEVTLTTASGVDVSNAHVGIVVYADHKENPTSEQLYTLVDEAVQRLEETEGDMWLNPQDVTVLRDDGTQARGVLYAYNPNYEGADWSEGVPAGTEMRLFNEINIPTSWGNAYAHTNFDIKVEAYAIQADNLEANQLASAIQGQLQDDEGAVVRFEKYEG